MTLGDKARKVSLPHGPAAPSCSHLDFQPGFYRSPSPRYGRISYAPIPLARSINIFSHTFVDYISTSKIGTQLRAAT